MTSPEGLIIGRGWRIGKQLGSGACGSVHELTASSGSKSKPNSPAWAVKIAPLPKSVTSTKGKKRKKTQEERNADLILHEYTTLQNVGSAIRGLMVPEISFMGDPPAYGETEDGKFRFLVMERMQAPLSEVIPILLDSYSKPAGAVKVPMGDVAIAMLNCIQAMHENGYLFVDVKPENFMLSATVSAASSKRSKTDVSQRIRLIDFGLVERFGDMAACRHRENAFPNAPLVGTPTYASLNIMSGHTASFRDDVEALGYVICELILMMASSGGITSGSGVLSKRKAKGEKNVLPWSHAMSDNELHQMKSQEMDKSKRSKSVLFAQLKAAGADKVMDSFFSAVTGLKYSEKPDYNSLLCCLKGLVVAVNGKSASTDTKKTVKTAEKVPYRKAGARAIHTLLDDEDDASMSIIDENAVNSQPPSDKRRKKSAAKDSAKLRSGDGIRSVPMTRDADIQSDKVMVINLEDDDDDDAMDWDPVESTAKGRSKTKGNCNLNLDIIEGPHKGQIIPFGGSYPITVCLGSDPASRAMKDTIKFALLGDTNISPLHAKFVLNSKSTVNSVRVTDMSSTSGTVINGSILPSGKSRQVFVGDKIKIGGTTIQIRKA